MTLRDESVSEHLGLLVTQLSFLSCKQFPESPGSKSSRVDTVDVLMATLTDANYVLLTEFVVALLVEHRENLGEHELAAHVVSLDNAITPTTLSA